MTEEHPITAPLTDDELSEVTARPFTELTVNELMDMKDAYAARGSRVYNSATVETIILAFLAGKIGVPFIQTLAQRAANGVADWSKDATAAVLKQLKRKGRSDDTPWIALPDHMTDEAWLALFELVETGELHGKVVRWDENAVTWRADNAED